MWVIVYQELSENQKHPITLQDMYDPVGEGQEAVLSSSVVLEGTQDIPSRCQLDP